MSVQQSLRTSIWGATAHEDAKSTRLREGRVQAARANRHWIELEESALVRRGPYLVGADSDAVFTFCRGAIFLTGSPRIEFDENVEHWFYVDVVGEVRVLERHRETWSAIVERRAKRAMTA